MSFEYYIVYFEDIYVDIKLRTGVLNVSSVGVAVHPRGCNMPLRTFYKGNVRAAVAPDVKHARSSVVMAEWSRCNPHAIWGRPPGAWNGLDDSAVRPTEEQAEVHAGHVAPTTAIPLRSAKLGTSGGALLVGSNDGNSAEPVVEANAVVMIAARAIIGCNQC